MKEEEYEKEIDKELKELSFEDLENDMGIVGDLGGDDYLTASIQTRYQEKIWRLKKQLSEFAKLQSSNK